jgi:hypothetical protein
MCTSFNSYVDENKESSNIIADLTLPNNKIHPNSVFSLMKMDKLFKEHDLSKFDYVIIIDDLKLSKNKLGQNVVNMSFHYTVDDMSYKKEYHYVITESKMELINWLNFYLDIYKDETVKKMMLLDCVA